MAKTEAIQLNMTTITFVEFNGTEHRVEAEDGKSVMKNAIDNSVPGILGDCGGCCTCATCHGYIDPAFLPRLAPKSPDEEAMLDGVLELKDNSRLTCQITVSPVVEGLIVRLPASQI